MVSAVVAGVPSGEKEVEGAQRGGQALVSTRQLILFHFLDSVVAGVMEPKMGMLHV